MPNTYLKKIQAGLSPEERLYQIVEHGMCIGCGICQSIAGQDLVEMQIVENDAERPVIKDNLSHEIVDKIMDVCPGTRVEGLPAREVGDESKNDSVWGVWSEITLAYAAEPKVRHIGSTGGLMTALGLYLLESNTVNFILHATISKINPTFGERFISRNRDDVLTAAGSRYGPTATLIDIDHVLTNAESNNETFAFMGTPCDVSALRNLARHDARVDQHCRYMLAMVCGGFMEPEGMKNFLASLGIRFDEVTSLRYRGYGCPGPTRIETASGDIIEKNYLDFWGEDESAWRLPFRCKICPDGIGDATDIACSDTWDGGSPTWEGQKTDLGTNAVIARTDKAVQLMHDAEQTGYIVIEKQITPRDMDRFQPHQENKKRTVWSRFAGMKSAGAIVPDTRGLRLESLARENDFHFNLQQARGTKTRIKQGKSRENTPKPALSEH
ncbi:MAG: Coenzyme F420 hydrogenase/dehydrogenase, beta subunit C-terminal domain [Gammaproteobacteria bacterium]|nr:Coenzyme F420 hydrogenase/dehydrogenase, beta subunit C-terminal domain [Gammaproteobacteria bacterium]